jgi:hypothetical protein
LQGYEDVINGVIGYGEAVSIIDGTWFGSLSEFQVGSGYWFQVNQDVAFQYNLMSTSSTSQNYIPVDISLPQDLAQASINDVFDDIRNQVESQTGSVRPRPIRQSNPIVNKLNDRNNQQSFTNIEHTRVECDKWDDLAYSYLKGYDCTVDGETNSNGVLNCMCGPGICHCK